MRSLTRDDQDDCGAVLVFVALTIVVLLGMGALVLDMGALYAERRQLQNGADAAALAVAIDCAGKTGVPGDCKDGATADRYAEANANDAAAKVDLVCGDGPNLDPCATPPPEAAGKKNWVQVTTSTQNPDDTEQVDFVLAPVFGKDGGTVRASAVAAWGGIGGATTIPVAFGLCEFTRLGGTLDPDTLKPIVLPNTFGHIYLHGREPATPLPDNCPEKPGASNQKLPGGFGWLKTLNNTTCETNPLTVNGPADSNTGEPVPMGCDPEDWQEEVVLIPLYDGDNGLTGNNAKYNIVGFIGFRVLGYHLVGGGTWWKDPTKAGDCTGSVRCLYGEFTNYVSTDDTGGGSDFGARTISMIG